MNKAQKDILEEEYNIILNHSWPLIVHGNDAFIISFHNWEWILAVPNWHTCTLV